MNDSESELPAACSLQAAQLGDRRAVWERLAERALRETRCATGGVQLVYAGAEETQRELEELARLEAECCAFAEWRVTRRGEEILLDVTAAADGVAAVRALFGVSQPEGERRPPSPGARSRPSAGPKLAVRAPT